MRLLSEASLGDVYADRVVILPSRSHEMVLALTHLLAHRDCWDVVADEVWDDLQAEVALTLSALMNYVAECEGDNVEIVQFSHFTGSGVSGGSAVAATWNIRLLNWDGVQQDWASRDGSVVTLQAGRYHLNLVQSAYQTGHTRGGLYVNIGGAISTIEGVWNYLDVSSNVELNCVGDWCIEVPDTASLTPEMYTQLAKAGNGMGIAQTGVNNQFAVLTIIRLGDPTS